MGEGGILLVVELVSGPGIKENIGHVIWSWVGDQGAVAGFQCVMGVAAAAA